MNFQSSIEKNNSISQDENSNPKKEEKINSFQVKIPKKLKPKQPKNMNTNIENKNSQNTLENSILFLQLLFSDETNVSFD